MYDKNNSFFFKNILINIEFQCINTTGCDALLIIANIFNNLRVQLIVNNPYGSEQLTEFINRL